MIQIQKISTEEQGNSHNPPSMQNAECRHVFHDTRPLLLPLQLALPSSYACLSNIFRAQLRQGVATGQNPVDLEIRIALDTIVLVIEIR